MEWQGGWRRLEAQGRRKQRLEVIACRDREREGRSLEREQGCHPSSLILGGLSAYTESTFQVAPGFGVGAV